MSTGPGPKGTTRVGVAVGGELVRETVGTDVVADGVADDRAVAEGNDEGLGSPWAGVGAASSHPVSATVATATRAATLVLRRPMVRVKKPAMRMAKYNWEAWHLGGAEFR